MQRVIMPRHAAHRDRMLEIAVETLTADERFVAAWLGGSFGRDEQDDLSDIDLSIVVVDQFASRLCHRSHQVGAGTTPERLTLIRVIGEPAFVHENHSNAPSGGSFTTSVYSDTGVIFDWVLIPQSMARRPEDTKLLFDAVGIPASLPAPPLTDDERTHRLSEQVAFFWIMVVTTSKAWRRRDMVQYHQRLEMTARTSEEVERLLDNRPWQYIRRSRASFLTSESEQRGAIVDLCRHMMALSPALKQAGATIPTSPMQAVETWLAP